MVQHIGKRAFCLDLEPFSHSEGFAQPRRQVDQAWTLNRAYLTVAEATDWQWMRAERLVGQRIESDTRCARVADGPGRLAWAGKRGGISPVEAVLPGGIDADAGKLVGVLAAAPSIETDAAGAYGAIQP